MMTTNDADVVIDRTRFDFAGAFCITCVFPIGWTADALNVIDAGISDSLWYTLFVWCATPVAVAWCLYSAFVREPLITIHNDRIDVYSSERPWRCVSLEANDILKLETDWWPGTTRCYLVFHVTVDAFEQQKRNRAWLRRRSGRLYLNLVHSQLNPHEAAAKISRVLGCSYVPMPQP